ATIATKRTILRNDQIMPASLKFGRKGGGGGGCGNPATSECDPLRHAGLTFGGKAADLRDRPCQVPGLQRRLGAGKDRIRVLSVARREGSGPGLRPQEGQEPVPGGAGRGLPQGGCESVARSARERGAERIQGRYPLALLGEGRRDLESRAAQFGERRVEGSTGRQRRVDPAKC